MKSQRLPVGRMLSAAALTLCVIAAPSARGEIAFEKSWRLPDYSSVRSDVLAWLDDADLDRTELDRARRLWPSEAPEDVAGSAMLDRVAETLALVSQDAAELVELCARPFEGPAAADPQWLSESSEAELVRHNMRLYYARWLAQQGLYDEVLLHIRELRPADVVDPASLLFYQMAAYHQLVLPEEARAALVRLMEHEGALPRRFQQVAQLVERDLSSLEDESLDHIARRMRDIRRRLGYGRAGAKVQEVEQGVLESLDKKIDDLEKQQQQQQQQQAAANGGSPQSSRPMDDSRPAELKAPMQVDRRNIGDKIDWGDLPPKERERALQQIGREFPAHYRELVEQYFRELANEPTRPNDR